MDYVLRCNSLKCRRPLTERAVVTTCSHIFCEACTHSLGLSAAQEGNRICPACQSSLPNPDDAVTTTLNPSEDYKTSVLSGLAPSMIIECAGRGLAFWSYQSTQEIVYQEYLAKTLTEKYNNAKIELDHIVNQANSEIDMLTQKLSNMAMDNDRLRTEAQTLAINLKDRAKKHQQTQELYDRLKRKQMTAATQFAARTAASEAVEDGNWNDNDGTSHTLRGSNAYSTGQHTADQHHRFRRPESSTGHGFAGMMPPPPPPRLGNQGGMASTPQRTQIGNQGPLGSSRLRNVSNNTPSSSQPTPRQRQPLSRISPNASSMNGYGMSAGLKVGRQISPRHGEENQAPLGRTGLRRSPRLAGYSQQGQDGNSAFY